MAKFLLNTTLVEEDFFSDCRLLAVGTGLKGYSLCWWLNQTLGLNFIREPELDICLQEGKILPQGRGTLFDEVLVEEEIKKKYYFPVYRHELPYFDASIFLYGNRCTVKKLVPELRHADFLLLVQFADYLEQDYDFSVNITAIPGVSWVRELEIETLKSRRNLIL